MAQPPYPGWYAGESSQGQAPMAGPYEYPDAPVPSFTYSDVPYPGEYSSMTADDILRLIPDFESLCMPQGFLLGTADQGLQVGTQASIPHSQATALVRIATTGNVSLVPYNPPFFTMIDSNGNKVCDITLQLPHLRSGRKRKFEAPLGAYAKSNKWLLENQPDWIADERLLVFLLDYELPDITWSYADAITGTTRPRYYADRLKDLVTRALMDRANARMTNYKHEKDAFVNERAQYRYARDRALELERAQNEATAAAAGPSNAPAQEAAAKSKRRSHRGESSAAARGAEPKPGKGWRKGKQKESRKGKGKEARREVVPADAEMSQPYEQPAASGSASGYSQPGPPRAEDYADWLAHNNPGPQETWDIPENYYTDMFQELLGDLNPDPLNAFFDLNDHDLYHWDPNAEHNPE